MKHAAILALLIGGLFYLVSGKIVATPYNYDEADYMFDASLGCFANWMDTASMPILQWRRCRDASTRTVESMRGSKSCPLR